MSAHQLSNIARVRVPQAKWRFPDSNHGLFQDYNDNQATHFARIPINHLVRECIQNSIDARISVEHAVEVSFSEVHIPTSILDVENYCEHLSSCVTEAKGRGNADAVADYQRALKVLQSDTIPALRIQDTATTGLTGANWEALVSSQGAVRKNVNNGAPGGSFGVGKNAAFLFSNIHAIIYSTRYANRREGAVQKMVGRAQLMSHPKGDRLDHHQPNGWLDVDRSPLMGRNIPRQLRLSEPGTAIFILGWQPDNSSWPQEIALRAAQNFFSAIHWRLLRILVSDDVEQHSVVDHRTVEHILTTADAPNAKRFLNYYYAVCNQPETAVRADATATFTAYIQQGCGPNRTALVTGNGMFVTDATSLAYNPFHVRHKSTWPDHAVVVCPADETTDRWIRDMENPSHDSVSPDQLKVPDARKQATELFQSARRQLRNILGDMAGLAAPGETVNVVELADILPEGKEILSNDEFEVNLHITQPTQADLQKSELGPGARATTQSEPTNHATIETNECNVSTDATTSGDNPNNDVPQALETAARPSSIARHRIIALDRHSAHVFITPGDHPAVRVSVKPAGAEFRREQSITVTSAKILSHPGVTILADFPTDAFQFTSPPGERIHLELTFQSSIENLALKLA